MATFPQEPGRRWTRSSLLPACWRACSQHPEESWNIRDGFYYGTLRYKTRYGCTVNTLRGLFKWRFLLFRQLKWQQHKRWHAGRRAGELSAEARLVGCNPEGALLDAQPLHWWDETFPCCWLVTRVTLTVFFFKKTVLVHTGPNSNAGVCTSHRPNQHHPSRPNQDDAVQAEAAEITPEGG